MAKLEEFQTRNSGWAVYEILQLKVNINHYSGINLEFSTFTDLHSIFKNGKAVKSNDLQ